MKSFACLVTLVLLFTASVAEVIQKAELASTKLSVKPGTTHEFEKMHIPEIIRKGSRMPVLNVNNELKSTESAMTKISLRSTYSVLLITNYENDDCTGDVTGLHDTPNMFYIFVMYF